MSNDAFASSPAPSSTGRSGESVVRIGALLPDIMSTYGDDGNALVLRERLRWRGYQAEIIPFTLSDTAAGSCDIYTIGGGEDVAQILGAQHLRQQRALLTAISSGTPLLAICAGLQMLGEWFQVGDGSRAQGVGLLDVTTVPQESRAIGELVGAPCIPGMTELLTGFENHLGATTLGPDASPLSTVKHGCGNGAAVAGSTTPVDGVIQGSVIATYMHGPCLARNPHLADYLLAQALGIQVEELAPLPLPVVDQLRAERCAAARKHSS